MATILDGKALAEELNAFNARRVAKLAEADVVPGLAIISFGEESGQVYVKNKIKTCEKLGIHCEHILFTEEEDWNNESGIIHEIDRLNKRDDIHGIIVQLPIPYSFNVSVRNIINAIDPKKDVDGLTEVNVGALWSSCDPEHFPCTPLGIMSLFRSYDIPLEGKNVVIIGRSDLVGKPLAAMMLEENATVEIWHSHTNPGNRDHMIQHADIIVCATGRPNMLDRYDCQSKIVIDVGINRVDGKIVGDIPESVKGGFSKAYTPVPGGVGPMTVAMLMNNVINAAEWRWLGELIEGEN